MTHPARQNDCVESATATYQTTYDPETDSVSEELLSALTTIRGSQPDEVTSLAYTIDLDALDALVSPRENGVARDGVCSVEFEYGSHHIRVTSDGTITIRSPE